MSGVESERRIDVGCGGRAKRRNKRKFRRRGR